MRFARAFQLLDVLYLALLVCLALGATDYLLSEYRQGKLFAYVSGDSYSFSDFVHYYQAGQMVLSDDRARIYDPEVQLEWFNQLFTSYRFSKPHFIQYVPFIFPLSVPLTWLPMDRSFLAWACLSLSLGYATIVLAGKSLGKLSAVSLSLLFLGALASYVSLLSIRIGQPSWLLASLLCIYTWGLLKKSDVPGGLALALTTFKPHYSLFLAIPALAMRRWRLLVVALLAEAALVTLAGLTVGWSNVFGYPGILMRADTTEQYLGVHPEKMVCLRGLISQWLPQSQALPLSLLLMLAALAAMAVLWRLTLRNPDETVRTAMAVLVPAALVFSPHTHVYDYLLLVLPAAITLPGLKIDKLISLEPPAFRVWCLLLYLYPVLSWALQLAPALGPVRMPGPFFLMTLLNCALLACGLWHWVGRLRAGSESAP